jgi:glucose-6-phosphate 1-epimerase
MEMHSAMRKELSMHGVGLEPAQGGFPLLTIKNEHAECSLFLHGAHVISFKPKKTTELLFLSPHSLFVKGKPIRGGIPLCFPWFGKHPLREDLPLHGVIRTQMWKLLGITEETDGSTTIVLETHDDEDTRSVWPHRFSIHLTLNVSHSLTMTLEVTNSDEYPFVFEEAFHTYFSVGGLSSCTVEGLDGLTVLDRLKEDQPALHAGPVKISGEFVRVYKNAGLLVELVDPNNSRRILMRQDNLHHVVVWNPGAVAAMKNSEILDSWNTYLCVEHANCLDAAITLHPGETHYSTLSISAIPDHEAFEIS